MRGTLALGSWVCGLWSVVCGLWLLPAASAAERPRVSLALSGGSALGLAHIGVLQWLDENHIPVDAIAGTSMGGLIGAVYAMGMPPEDIRRLASGISWEQAFSGFPPYRSLSFRRKEDAAQFPGGITFGLSHGFRMPSGLDPAQPINILLSRLSFPYSDAPSFDDLPIPFRCVAVDLVSGERIVLGSGPLALALRSTMAIPGLFTPVQYDGKVLVDGGLLDNLPVDVARSMGPGVVIAVDVLNHRRVRGLLDSPLSVLSRSVEVALNQGVQESRRLADIVVSVPTEGFGAYDFDRSRALADAGYRAATAAAASLLPYRLDDAAWNAYLAARAARRRSAALVPQFLQIDGACRATCRAATQMLRPFIGRPLVLRELEAALIGIAGLGRIEQLLYAKARQGAQEGLAIYAQEKRYGPPFVDAILDVNGADAEAVQFSIPARLTQFDVAAPGAELRADLTLGSRIRLGAEYYRPLGPHGWFVAPRGFSDHYTVPFSSLQHSEGGYGIRQLSAGIDLGRTYGRHSELRLGIEAGHATLSPRSGSLLPSVDGRYSALSARWTTDDQDAPVVPTHGTRFHVDARWHLRAPTGDRSFPGVSASATDFGPLGAHNTRFLMLSAGSTFGGRSVLESRTDTISPLRLGPVPGGDAFGRHHLLLGLGALRSVSRIPDPVGGRIFLGAWYTQGGVFSDWKRARLEGGLTAGVLADTTIGPAFVGVTWAEGTQRIHFAIGRFMKSGP